MDLSGLKQIKSSRLVVAAAIQRSLADAERQKLLYIKLRNAASESSPSNTAHVSVAAFVRNAA